jgi:hypothetical protein
MRRNDSRQIPSKAAILLLLVALFGLSTLARHSQYLPETNPVHFFSSTTKMDVDHLPALFFPEATLVAKVFPDDPRCQRFLRTTSQEIDVPQISLTLSLQHRSPPVALA